MHLYITRINGMGGTTQYMQSMTANIAHQLGFREMGYIAIMRMRKVRENVLSGLME